MAQQVKDLALSLTAAQVTGVAQVQSLAQELPRIMGADKKKKKIDKRILNSIFV